MERNPRSIEERKKEDQYDESDEHLTTEAGPSRAYKNLRAEVDRIIDIGKNLERDDLTVEQRDFYVKQYYSLQESVGESFALFSESLEKGINFIETLDSLNALCRETGGYLKDRALEVLEDFSSIISEKIQINDPAKNYYCGEALIHLSDEGYGGGELWGSIDRLRLTLHDRYKPFYGRILEVVANNARDEETRDFAIKYSVRFRGQEFFTRVGLRAKDFFNAWRVGSRSDDLERISLENVDMVIALEKKRPGIVKYLHEACNIFHFARYTEELLVRQFDDRENMKIPYGMVVYPHTDWNTAFYATKYALSWLEVELRGKYALRITEARDKIDIARITRKFDRTYGAEQKISFVILGGHGTEDSIEFGQKEKGDARYTGRHTLQSRDFQDPRSGLNRYFKDHPTIIMVSCSTGAEGGIAQKLSELLDAKVIAPPIATNLDGFFGTRVAPDGSIDFKVQYRRASPMSYSRGDAVIPKE